MSWGVCNLTLGTLFARADAVMIDHVLLSLIRRRVVESRCHSSLQAIIFITVCVFSYFGAKMASQCYCNICVLRYGSSTPLINWWDLLYPKLIQKFSSSRHIFNLVISDTLSYWEIIILYCKTLDLPNQLPLNPTFFQWWYDKRFHQQVEVCGYHLIMLHHTLPSRRDHLRLQRHRSLSVLLHCVFR